MEKPELRIKTMPGVYEPAEDSYLAADLLWAHLAESKRKDLSVLDMGTGSGILGLTAAANPNVSRVTMADSNRQALALAEGNMHLNMQKLNAKCDFVESNLFSSIPDSEFELIVFNPPYLPKDGNEKALEQTWYGGKDGIEVTVEFLKQAKRYLSKDGAIIIVSSSFANREKLMANAQELGFATQTESKRHLFFEDIYATVLKSAK